VTKQRHSFIQELITCCFWQQKAHCDACVSRQSR